LSASLGRTGQVVMDMSPFVWHDLSLVLASGNALVAQSPTGFQ